MIQLTQAAKDTIKSRDGMRLRNRLAYELNKSWATIERWIENDDPMLTAATSLNIIREETGLTDEQLLTEEQSA